MNEMLQILLAIFSSYIITKVMVDGSILEPFRLWLMRQTKWMQIKGHPHFIVCRLCVGIWVSMFVGLWTECNVLLVYGASYWLATQER